MVEINRQQAGAQLIKAFLQPWRDAMANPSEAQQKVLKGLLAIYAQTVYGSQHNASNVTGLPTLHISTLKPRCWYKCRKTGK